MKPIRFLDLTDVIELNGTSILVDSQGKDWLVSVSNGIARIFFNKCPHHGQPLKASNSRYVCTGHNWVFDATGENLVKNGQCLEEFFDFKIDSNLCTLNWFEETRKISHSEILENLEIAFHSHACLELKSEDFTLITDPWTKPSTYDGNWVHWPDRINIRMNKPSAIVVTHEHPDHFHEESLLDFELDTLIIIPNYLNLNLRNRLQYMGFSNLVVLNYNEVFEVTSGVEIKFLRPSSKWEDAILDLNFFGFRWLNINDAGYISSENLLASRYDLITAAFDVFASDYPMMWSGVNSKMIDTHIRSSKASALSHLLRLSIIADARYFLPFASFWRLNPSRFEELESKMDHLTLNAIHNYFVENRAKTEVLDFLPGEVYSFQEKVLRVKRPDRDEVKSGQIGTRAIEVPNMQLCVGKKCLALVKESVEFFSKLAGYSSFFRCEDVKLDVYCSCGEFILSQLFGDEPNHENRVDITITIPYEQLEKFVRHSYSFESLRIGYWIHFKRNKNIYTPNFLRLLAFGENVSTIKNQIVNDDFKTIDLIPLAEIMNLDPELFGRVFNRSGLPCASCKHLLQENLGDAMDIHKLPKQDRDFLRAEVAWIFGKK